MMLKQNLFFVFLILHHQYTNAVFSLHYLKNTGAAFSLLQNAREFLIIISIVATTFLFTYVHNHIRSLNMISISFIALLGAGIMSNCHERIVLGYVRDYIHLNFMNFPIFNIADIFITVGVISLIAILLFYKGR